MPHATNRLDVAGRDITDYLLKLLNEPLTSKSGDLNIERAGYNFQTLSEKETIKNMKEKLGYIANDFEQEINKGFIDVHKKYGLPDGKARDYNWS